MNEKPLPTCFWYFVWTELKQWLQTHNCKYNSIMDSSAPNKDGVNYNYPWDSTRVSSIASVTQYVPPFIRVGLIKLWCTYLLVHCARYANEKFGKAHDIIFIWKLMYLETFSYLSPSCQGHELLGLVVESTLNGK